MEGYITNFVYYCFLESPSMVANTKKDKMMKIELVDDVFTILDLENL